MAVKIDNYLWGVTSLIKMQANMNSLNCHYLESHRAHEGFSLHVFLWVGKGEHAWANEISLHAIIKRKKSNCIYIYICMLRLEITKHLNICSFLCTDSGFNSPLFYFSFINLQSRIENAIMLIWQQSFCINLHGVVKERRIRTWNFRVCQFRKLSGRNMYPSAPMWE